MNGRLTMVTQERAEAAARSMILRADMAEQLAASAGVIPLGPKWLLTPEFAQNGKLAPLAMGGLEPSGAGASLAWLLVSDLDRRGWVMVRQALLDCLQWARCHAIRRIHALVANDQPKHAALLSRLGFRLTGQEGHNAVMTLELR